VRGTVIITQHGLRNVNSIDETKIRAEAGLSCAKVARFSVRKALLGAEFLAGIPGTMGGALAMNAGAFGGETWNVVHAVEAINRFGDIVVRHANEYKASYRQVIMPCEDEWFVAGHLALVPGNSDDAMQRIRECIMWRNSSQPTNSPSCGSVFRNPPNSYAGYLIETAGLKGFTIGGAIVSDKHANFILNINRATARDIETLILHVIDTVERMHGIRLQTEVKFIGEEGMG
jgi:UDP-N-acetylmuramate dehydrogenase